MRAAQSAQQRVQITERLVAGTAELGLSLSDTQHQQLLDYLELLLKWNSVYNLTALRTPEAMLDGHLLDSLAVVPLVRELGPASLIDVGSGAGLPGIPIAIALAGPRVTLIDAVQKKVAFLNQVKSSLGLSIDAIHGRIEDLAGQTRFDTAISRAFASLSKFAGLAGGIVGQGGRLVAMKANDIDAEIEELPPPWRVERVASLKVPQVSTNRCAVVLSRSAPSGTPSH